MPERSKPHILSNFVYNTLKGMRTHYHVPAQAALDNLFECMYYASMQSEEGQLIQVTVTFYNPEEVRQLSEKETPFDRWKFSRFDEPIPLDIKSLVKLSKAADPWSSSVSGFLRQFR